MQISVGVHTGHTVVTNFYIGPVKKVYAALSHPQGRLINPAKNEPGTISKTILDNRNMKLFQTIKISQWKNKVSAIKLFNSVKDKHLGKFFMFDINDIYPSITQDLLKKARNCASE